MLVDLSLWPTVVSGLTLFGLVFAVNSSVHSYLILAYTESDQAAFVLVAAMISLKLPRGRVKKFA